LRQLIDQTLDAVGLADKANRRAGALSGGEAQRLGLAQALVAEPALLILDEPAASLDPQGRQQVLGLLAGLRGDTTVFYSTHILEDVQRVSDSVAILANGRVAAQGPIDELLEATTGGWTIRIAGQMATARERLEAQPWVTSLTARLRGDQELWTVDVSDDSVAAEHMLPLLLSNDSCDVMEFHRAERTLEDAYLEVVEANHGR
jgi:ABC-2 type transport system ATP-binding protein